MITKTKMHGTGAAAVAKYIGVWGGVIPPVYEDVRVNRPKKKAHILKYLNAEKTNLLLRNRYIFVRKFNGKEYHLNWFFGTKAQAEQSARDLTHLGKEKGIFSFVRTIPVELDYGVTIYEQYTRSNPAFMKKHGFEIRPEEEIWDQKIYLN